MGPPAINGQGKRHKPYATSTPTAMGRPGTQSRWQPQEKRRKSTRLAALLRAQDARAQAAATVHCAMTAYIALIERILRNSKALALLHAGGGQSVGTP